MSFSFKSGDFNVSKLKEALEAEKKKPTQDFGNDLFFKPAAVKNQEKTKFKIRFLPVVDSSLGKPWVQINYHMFERQGDNKYVKVIDPRSFNKDAANPIADAASSLFKSANALDQDLARKLYRKPRYFTLIYVKEAPENQQQFVGKVLIYEAGKKIIEKLISKIEDGVCFYHPTEGHDFNLVMKMTSGDKWADYTLSEFDFKPGPISANEAEFKRIEALVGSTNIKDVVIKKDGVKSSAELKKIFEGGLKSVSEETGNHETSSKEVITGESVSSSATDITFGDEELELPKTEVKKAEASAPAAKVTASVETKKEIKEEELDISFDDEDFKL